MDRKEQLLNLIREHPELFGITLSLVLAYYQNPDRPAEEILREVCKKHGYQTGTLEL